MVVTRAPSTAISASDDHMPGSASSIAAASGAVSSTLAATRSPSAISPTVQVTGAVPARGAAASAAVMRGSGEAACAGAGSTRCAGTQMLRQSPRSTASWPDSGAPGVASVSSIGSTSAS